MTAPPDLSIIPPVMGYHLRAGAAAGPGEERCATRSVRTPRAGVGSGYRYYSPGLGRWVNRDPIGEEGGKNLFRTVNNDALSFVDILGQQLFELVTDAGGRAIELVVRAGELTRRETRQAERAMIRSLREARGVIERTSATGSLHRPPPGLAERIGSLEVGDRINISGTELTRSGLLVLNYLFWDKEASTRAFIAFAEAYQRYLVDRAKGGAEAYAACLEFCFAGSAFANSLPLLDRYAPWWANVCAIACCK